MDSVCVFCGSRDGNNPAYVAAAQATGRAIARRGWKLVYGGGHVGLMGALADAALAEDGEVIGVMPRALLTREIAHPGITRIHLVTSMHRRKALMASLVRWISDASGRIRHARGVLRDADLGAARPPHQAVRVARRRRFLGRSAGDGRYPDSMRDSPGDEHRQLILSGKDPDELLDRMAAYIPPGSIDPVPDLPIDGPPVHRDLEPNRLWTGTAPRSRRVADESEVGGRGRSGYRYRDALTRPADCRLRLPSAEPQLAAARILCGVFGICPKTAGRASRPTHAENTDQTLRRPE